eukprot:1800327-Rhodomonas_salina.2
MAREVAPYAPPTRCPVLTQATLLRVCYAMSGTNTGYAATRMLCDVRREQSMARGKVSSYADAMRCPALTYAVVLRACYAMSSTSTGYDATRLLCDVRLGYMAVRPYSQTDIWLFNHKAMYPEIWLHLRLCGHFPPGTVAIWLHRRGTVAIWLHSCGSVAMWLHRRGTEGLICAAQAARLMEIEERRRDGTKKPAVD